MTTWKKSSYSSDSFNCVEVRHVDGRVEVRDSKDPDGPGMTYSDEQWRHVLNSVRAGLLPHWGTVSAACRLPEGGMVWARGDVELRFTEAEWQAFEAGVRAGEFDGPVPVPA